VLGFCLPFAIGLLGGVCLGGRSEHVDEDAFAPNLTKVEASKRIDRLKAKKTKASKR